MSVARRHSRSAASDVATPLEGGSYGGRVRFEVLGRLRVVDGDDPSGGEGAGLPLGGARQQLVLAMLLADANTVVSTDTLVDGLWGDSPPSAARHTVQGYVSELRKLLGPVIERDGEGYVVRVDDDPGAAASVLRAALQLWRGPPFTALSSPATPTLSAMPSTVGAWCPVRTPTSRFSAVTSPRVRRPRSAASRSSPPLSAGSPSSAPTRRSVPDGERGAQRHPTTLRTTQRVLPI